MPESQAYSAIPSKSMTEFPKISCSSSPPPLSYTIGHGITLDTNIDRTSPTFEFAVLEVNKVNE